MLLMFRLKTATASLQDATCNADSMTMPMSKVLPSLSLQCFHADRLTLPSALAPGIHFSQEHEAVSNM